MDLLLTLRNSAMVCSRPEIRAALRASADRLDLAIRNFAEAPTEHNLILLNGLWASAVRVVKLIPPEGEPTSPAAAGGVGSFSEEKIAA